MLKFLLLPFLISESHNFNTNTNTNTNNTNITTTELSIYDNANNITNIKIINFLYKINEGQRLIYDMCEVLDETYSIISGSNKPNCEYNISYIDKTDIQVYNIKKDIRTFFQEEKKNFCKKQKIECGELTIIIKLLDIINSAIKLAFINNNKDDLWTNLKIIDFNELFNLYANSLNNVNILTNITLAKQKANVILEIEKNRLRKEISRTWLQQSTNKISIYLGEPIYNLLNYAGSSFGDLLSTTVEHSLPKLSMEYKCIIGLVLILLIKRK